MRDVGLINYGASNFTSVSNALSYLDIDFVEIRSSDQLDAVRRVILPGVGSYAAAMRRLREMCIIDALHDAVFLAQKPYLGICVGLQILSDMGYEFEQTQGLGCIRGVTTQLAVTELGLRLPHMGWNEVHAAPGCALFDGLPEAPAFYFLHSFHLEVEDPDVTAATTKYGGEVVAAVRKENIYGVQFHPEKSQAAGLQLLDNFARIGD